MRGTSNPVRAVVVAAFVATTTAIGACAGDLPAGDDTPAAPDPIEAVPYEGATTSAAIATANLNSQVDGLRAQFERVPALPIATGLTGVLEVRAGLLGRTSDLALRLDVAERMVATDPSNPRAHVLHAEALSALHEFDAALQALSLAEELGADVTPQREAVAMAAGFETPVADRQGRVDDSPTFTRWLALATALAEAGDYERADAAYVAALTAYTDVSPLTVAWIQFQRGVLWGEAVGDDAKAEALYRDAVRLVPDYVVANVHLAELEAAAGDLEAAVQRLRTVTDSEDPEPWSRLAEYLADLDPVAAAEAAMEARHRYDVLLGDYELAYADHAAEFYLGAGDDADRALALATLNLENRTTDRAYQLAVEAAAAAGRLDQACDWLAEAGPERRRVGLLELRESLECAASR